ncbi:hypothetical protein B0T20DRAFT_362849 [Sordaria brevicollis]|uniref:Uncharacterized protein n=1 Tax=Sordaria brevicollis TaxID=83679 RepID=A0AAE0P134_SORBR|nr:hypothetical protein B0T20DRAFT_362849 [Sordaria brevicollis]
MSTTPNSAEAIQALIPSINIFSDGFINYIGINIAITPSLKSRMAARLLRYEPTSPHTTNPLPSVPQGRSRYIIRPSSSWTSRHTPSRFSLLRARATSATDSECPPPPPTPLGPLAPVSGIGPHEPVVWLPAHQVWVKNYQGNVVPPSNKSRTGPQSFVSLLGRDGVYAAVCHISQVEKVVAYIADVNKEVSERLGIATGGIDGPEDERRWVYVVSCVGEEEGERGWEGFVEGDAGSGLEGEEKREEVDDNLP